MPKSYASSATISTSKSNVNPGDTVELYIDLGTASIGYDLKINVSDISLISSSQVVSTIGSGDASRIYLIQMASSAERTIYPVGTRIATIKYTISDSVAEGSNISFSVTGDIAGETSSSKNTLNESATINVVKKEENNNNENQNEDKNQEQENNQQNEEVKKTESISSQSDETISKNVLPKTGITKAFSIIIICLFIIFIRYIVKLKKNSDIK